MRFAAESHVHGTASPSGLAVCDVCGSCEQGFRGGHMLRTAPRVQSLIDAEQLTIFINHSDAWFNSVFAHVLGAGRIGTRQWFTALRPALCCESLRLHLLVSAVRLHWEHWNPLALWAHAVVVQTLLSGR